MSSHVLYCRTDCPACRSVAAQLARSGMPVEVRDITRDPDALREITRLGFRSLPVLLAGDGSAAAGAQATALSVSLSRIPGSPDGDAHNHVIDQEEPR